MVSSDWPMGLMDNCSSRCIDRSLRLVGSVSGSCIGLWRELDGFPAKRLKEFSDAKSGGLCSETIAGALFGCCIVAKEFL